MVLRLLGGRQTWQEGSTTCGDVGLPLVALGGEAAPTPS